MDALAGTIRYERTAEPTVMFNCHCRDCQRASGGPYTGLVYVSVPLFKITKGTPRYSNTSSEAMGDNKRAFCPECSSRLFRGITDEGCGITCARTMQHAAQASKTRIVTKRRTTQARRCSNSARRHCTSPCRGRRVEWNDQRRGMIRLHFRARLICRRCAFGAS